MFVESVTHNLKNLGNFRGRQSQGKFWPYAGVVLIVSMFGTVVMMMPEFEATMMRMQRFAVEHPESATIEQGPGSYSITIHGYHPELVPDFGRMLGSMAPTLIFMLVFLAAAVARRLHDRGKTALWALAPIPFLVIGGVGMTFLLARAPTDLDAFLPLFLALFTNNVVYLASLVYLVILLAGGSAKGENRFGAQPVS